MRKELSESEVVTTVREIRDKAPGIGAYKLFLMLRVLYPQEMRGCDACRQRQERCRKYPPLGEGWTGEEAWAIALYCAVRHIDSMEEAIIAAVNHDGDSDSTGAVCGNIMGAIYGYEAMKRKRLFCPLGRELEPTLELSDIILTLADDLCTSCIISEYGLIDTPEKRQWYERYCEMTYRPR